MAAEKIEGKHCIVPFLDTNSAVHVKGANFTNGQSLVVFNDHGEHPNWAYWDMIYDAKSDAYFLRHHQYPQFYAGMRYPVQPPPDADIYHYRNPLDGIFLYENPDINIHRWLLAFTFELLPASFSTSGRCFMILDAKTKNYRWQRSFSSEIVSLDQTTTHIEKGDLQKIGWALK